MTRLALAFLLAILPAVPNAAQPEQPAPAKASAQRYACPMKCEGEKTYDADGKCPVCHMALKPAAAAEYTFAFAPMGGPVRGGESTTFTAAVTGPDGGPVNDMEMTHGAKLHLYMVSRDLAWFAHATGEPQSGGFTLEQTFPAGEYLVFASFKTSGRPAVLLSTPLSVQGKPANPKAMGTDGDRPKTMDGFTVTLDGFKAIKAGQEAVLTCRIAASGGAAPELDSYLSAPGQMVVISQDLKRLIQAEPANPASKGELAFRAVFPDKGLYRLWLQFRHGEKVITVPFVVEAQ